MMLSNSVYTRFLSKCDNGFIQIDSDGIILDVNNAVIDFTGINRNELVSSGIKIIFNQVLADEIVDILKNFKDDQLDAVRFGEIRTKQGSPRYAEIIINITEGADGEIYWLLIKNKSFRKEIETRLRRSELMLKTTLESLPFDFWINDHQNKTYMQNSYSKALWGDVTGKTPDETTNDAEISKNWIETTTRALNGEIVNSELSYTIAGKKRYFRNIIAPIMDDNNLLGILGMNIDISDLKESLNEREMLLKEVHHRVKNNLQMIISIIRLEESKHASDVEAQAVFKDIIHRIEAVSMIHEKLYMIDSKNVLHIDEYVKELVEHIVSGINPATLEVVYDLSAPDIDMNRIIILGLIVNELVTNSVKYAFNTEGIHRLTLSLHSDERTISVIVADNGPGLPSDFRHEECSSLGFRMMNVFAAQLGGRLQWESSTAGCTFHFSFPIT